MWDSDGLVFDQHRSQNVHANGVAVPSRRSFPFHPLSAKCLLWERKIEAEIFQLEVQPVQSHSDNWKLSSTDNTKFTELKPNFKSQYAGTKSREPGGAYTTDDG